MDSLSLIRLTIYKHKVSYFKSNLSSSYRKIKHCINCELHSQKITYSGDSCIIYVCPIGHREIIRPTITTKGESEQ